MNILLLNPNTTASMTDKIAAAARSCAHAGTIISAVQPASGPTSIEGYYDAAFAVPGVIEAIQQHPHAEAVIIACFDDTGLDAARCITDIPVLGIGEAAFHMANLVANQFGVVTTLACSVPVLEHNLQRYGLAQRCAKVCAAEIAVLELETSAATARTDISREIQKLVSEHGAEAIVLGCAGMADLAKILQDEHNVPVIDGVVSAVKLAESMVSLGMKTSKIGAYAWPNQKQYCGTLADYSPTGMHRQQ